MSNGQTASGAMSAVTCTKRAVLAAALATTAMAAVSTAPVVAAEIPSPETDLWDEFRQQVAEYRVANAAYEEAEARMPWWARPGRESINSAGEHIGFMSGWPADQSVVPPQGAGWRYIRTTPYQLHKEYNFFVGTMGFGDLPKSRSALRAKFRQRVRDQIKLRRQQRDEQRRVGLHELENRANQLRDRAYQTLGLLEDQRGVTPTSIATRVLLLITAEADPRDRIGCIETVSISLLEDLRPHLEGGVASVVDEVLTKYDEDVVTYADLSYWF